MISSSSLIGSFSIDSVKRAMSFEQVRNINEAIEFVNDYAPEHLQIMTRNPYEDLAKIRNAGSVFLGENAPVAIGDYASGVNHVLPTGQYAKTQRSRSFYHLSSRIGNMFYFSLLSRFKNTRTC